MKSTLLLFLDISVALVCFSQVDTLPVFKRFPYIPEFTIYRAPDSTIFTRENLKRKPSVFIIFSPDCEHCQRETKDILSNIDKFKKMQILMITYLPYEEMIKFYKEYKIAKYPVITMGRDTKFFFPIFFNVRNFPSIFVYDKEGKLKESFEGIVGVDKIAEALSL
jgi:thiol-disulfide isomerase/thioredoxin